MIIEFSGIDGSGKSTQIQRTMRWMNESGVPCYERVLRSTCRRVLGGIAAEQGLQSWRELFSVEAVQLATALEIMQAVYSTILPINTPAQVILTDTYARYWIADAIAYGSPAIAQLAMVYDRLPPVELSFHLDVPADVAYARILARPKGDHILRTGGLPRLRRLADAYGELPRHETRPVITLPSGVSEDETFRAIQRHLLEFLSTSSTAKDLAIYQRLHAAQLSEA